MPTDLLRTSTSKIFSVNITHELKGTGT
jgi:hypothetical protein